MGLRLFLGIPVSEPLRRAVTDWERDAWAGARGWRWVNPSLLHITLRFYGETPPERVEAISGDVCELARRERTFSLQARGWGTFPGSARPRVLWIGLSGDTAALARLAAAAEEDARRRGFAPEDRGFRPHLTIARAVRDTRPQLAGTPDATSPDFGRFPVQEIVLFRSHLRPGGPEYEALARMPLARDTEE